MNPTHKHKIAATEMGKLRIYMSPSEKPTASGLWAKIKARPLYQEIIRLAKKDGLMNAVAFQTHHGFSNSGAIESREPEIGAASMTMCVELIDHKHKLESFCRQHGELLKEKVIVYKHVEHWAIEADKLVETEIVDEASE